MGTALEASPKLNGNLLIPTLSLLKTVTLSCSTSLPPVNSLTQAQMGYGAGVVVVLSLEVLVLIIRYKQLNHLMVMENVFHLQIFLFSRFIKKVGRTCSLTRRMENSQYQSWKSGK
jgi:hypothetical protein